MKEFRFEVLHEDEKSGARVGVIHTRCGCIDTPHFVPVATLASVRALDSDDLTALNVQCLLTNAYHLHLKPGDELIKVLGGLHRFMAFERPIISDSAGFQAFSLGFGREHNIAKIGSIFTAGRESEEKRENLTRITDDGIHFKSAFDGAWCFLDPQSSMKIQANLGSEIIMAFDECTSPLSDYAYTKRAMERTHAWAGLSLQHHDRDQAIYGIIQGGWFEDLRRESTAFISALPFDGIAIGGSLGNSKRDMHQILEWIVPELDERPRHLLGIGELEDLFECVERGIDTFDCVTPTRLARRGNVLISPEAGGTPGNKFRITIKAGQYKDDRRPIDPHCTCPTCRSYSRAYLRHLYTTAELTYFRLATIHNLHFMLRLMELIRASIITGSFARLKQQWLKSG